MWISPIYPSPMADFGYDVADYCGIDPIFGTMRGLRSAACGGAPPRPQSDSGSSCPITRPISIRGFWRAGPLATNPKRDWYLWRDEPNNWLSHFGGSAWEYDDETGQYYCTRFSSSSRT